MTSLQKESEWDGVFQLVMEDIGKRYRVSDDLADILSDSLSKHLPEAITTAISQREKEIAEEVEGRKSKPSYGAYTTQDAKVFWEGKDAAFDEVLSILKH